MATITPLANVRDNMDVEHSAISATSASWQVPTIKRNHVLCMFGLVIMFPQSPLYSMNAGTVTIWSTVNLQDFVDL